MSIRVPLDPIHVPLPHGWRLHAVGDTASTNADVAEAARCGVAEGHIICAERQTSGRGRRGRSWQAPPGAGLTFSVLLRPPVPLARWGWLPLLGGVALAQAVRGTAGLSAGLKWPNDLLIHERKAAGILAEAVPGGVVLGIGLNVSQSAEELPTGPAGVPATSLLLAGATGLDREALLGAVLRGVADRYAEWCAGDGDPDRSGLRTAYLKACVTLGQEVRAILPGGAEFVGRARTVDADGRLVIEGPGGTSRPIAAADVIHVRQASSVPRAQEAKLDRTH